MKIFETTFGKFHTGEHRKIQLICRYESTNYGFRHVCEISVNGDQLWDGTHDKPLRASCAYYNRTWENYQYQSVLRQACQKLPDWLCPTDRDREKVFKQIDRRFARYY